MPFGLPLNSPLAALADRLFNRDRGQQQPNAGNSASGSGGSQQQPSSGSDSPFSSPSQGAPSSGGSSSSNPFSDQGKSQGSNQSGGSSSSPLWSDNNPMVGGSTAEQRQPSSGQSGQNQITRDQQISALLQEAHTAWALYDFETVIRNLRALDALAPGDPETARLIGVSYFNRARQLEDKNNYDDARRNYEEALQIEPDNAEYRGWYNQLNNRQDR